MFQTDIWFGHEKTHFHVPSFQNDFIRCNHNFDRLKGDSIRVRLRNISYCCRFCNVIGFRSGLVIVIHTQPRRGCPEVYHIIGGRRPGLVEHTVRDLMFTKLRKPLHHFTVMVLVGATFLQGPKWLVVSESYLPPLQMFESLFKLCSSSRYMLN